MIFFVLPTISTEHQKTEKEYGNYSAMCSLFSVNYRAVLTSGTALCILYMWHL